MNVELLKDLPAYCERENLVGSLANVSALLMENFKDINWIGFYLYDGKVLRLGPFQGKTACTQIAMGRGVCGKAAADKVSILVENVDQFPDHIVCDSASRSEVVVPVIQNNQLKGVLDVDSASLGRFNNQDQKFFECVVDVLIENLEF